MRLKGPPQPPSPFATVCAALDNAARSGETLTFVDAKERETILPWREVQRRARRVAGSLRARGVSAGDRVAIILPTCPSFPDAFFGALYSGAVPVPLYPPVRLGRMDEYHAATSRMLDVSGASVLVTDGRIRLLLGQTVANAQARPALWAASDLLDDSPGELDASAGEDALALVQFSSGSTVDPKPVALTHRNLVLQCATLKAMFPELPGTRQLGVSWLPLYHDMGLIGCLLLAAFYPGPLVLLPPEAFLVRPALWLRALSRHRATLSVAPNFAYGLCLKRIKDGELEGVDLSHWKYALDGAEPVSAPLLRRFAERFGAVGFDPAALMPVYGLSEASLAVTFSARRAPFRTESVDPLTLAQRGRAAPGAREVASVGRPVHGVEVEVRNELGVCVPEREVGLIFVRGGSVMKGYFGAQEATSRALQGGWLDTGDLGFVADGELHVCGRAKDLVIIRGANHPPQLFEECLDSVPGVRIGCAVALGYVPEATGSEELLVLAERDPEVPPSPWLPERIRAAILERTGIRAHDVKLIEPGTLPRTSSGKLRRREALRRFLTGELTAPNSAGLPRVAVELAKSLVAFRRRASGGAGDGA